MILGSFVSINEIWTKDLGKNSGTITIYDSVAVHRKDQSGSVILTGLFSPEFEKSGPAVQSSLQSFSSSRTDFLISTHANAGYKL